MNSAPRPHRTGPRVIEIIGVAGSGKSSLATALADAHEGWHIEGPLEVKNKHHLRRVAHGGSRLVRIMTGNLSQGRRLTWKESKYLLYVMEWPRHLASIPERESEVILLDQGPVYVLTRFGTADVPIVGCEPGDRWWNDTVASWADTLDAVVALDAPDPVLWERITSRAQSHEALDRGRSEWSTFAESYRRSFATVLNETDGPDGPLILRYDTNTMSTDQIAADVADRLAVGWGDGQEAPNDIDGAHGGNQ